VAGHFNLLFPFAARPLGTRKLPWLQFDLKSHSLHFWMTLILSALLGLLIYLLGALDNPFRGDVSVTPEPFELVYQRRMLTEK
jgi:hypothetical protein